MATGGAATVSRSVKSRPASRRVPNVRKKFGGTLFKKMGICPVENTVAPSTSIACDQQQLATGVNSDRLAD